jgi:hypothetical protein
MIMQDEETGSLWSHVTGEAMEGRMKGVQLNLVPSVQTTWGRWVDEHPDTKVLLKDEAIKSSRYERYFEDPDRIGIFRTEYLMDRMPGKDLVHGITRGPHALAISDFRLGPGQLFNVEVGDDPVVVIRTADAGVRAYVSRTKEKSLHFSRTGVPTTIQDRGTGSIWDLEKGLCIDGELKGTVLEEIVVRGAFWFAWSSFFPNTEVLD